MTRKFQPVIASLPSLDAAQQCIAHLRSAGFDADAASIIGRNFATASIALVVARRTRGNMTVGGLTSMTASLVCLGLSLSDACRRERETARGHFLLVIHGGDDQVESAVRILKRHGIRTRTASMQPVAEPSPYFLDPSLAMGDGCRKLAMPQGHLRVNADQSTAEHRA